MSASETTQLNPQDLVLPDATHSKLRNIAAAVAVGGGAAAAFGFTQAKSEFFFSYLYAFMFWLAMALGGVFFLLVQYLTRAGWSVTVRRCAEALASPLIIVLPLLFLPIVAGLHDLYPGTREGHFTGSKATYLSASFVLGRALFYFAVWGFIAWRLLGLSTAQDRTGDVSLTARAQGFAPAAMLLFALTLSFAAFDWMMALDPHWYSTIFGVYYFTSCAMGVFATMSLMAIGLRQLPAMHDLITIEHLHSLGKFLFGFTIFWAYIGFSQFMLIWYANIPEETEFFLHRFHNGWEYVSASLPIAHFALAFLILLPRAAKRTPSWLAFGSVFQLLFVAVDLFWIIAPNRPGEHATFTVADAGTFLFIGGVFWIFVLRKLKGEALVPHHDPRLEESLVSTN